MGHQGPIELRALNADRRQVGTQSSADRSARNLCGATLFDPLGFGLGYIGARLLYLAPPQRRAVCLETGIQNAPLAIAVVTLSVPADQVSDIWMAPLLYCVIVVPCSAVVAYGFMRAATGV